MIHHYIISTIVMFLSNINTKYKYVEESFYHTLAALCSPAGIFHSHLSSTGNLSFDKIVLRRIEVYWRKSCRWSLTSWFSWLFWLIVKVIKAVDVLDTKMFGYAVIFVQDLQKLVFVERTISNCPLKKCAALHLKQPVQGNVRYNKTW